MGSYPVKKSDVPEQGGIKIASRNWVGHFTYSERRFGRRNHCMCLWDRSSMNSLATCRSRWTASALTCGRSRARSSMGEAGATIVEFAIMLPVFVVLLFGSIEFMFAFGDLSALRSGVREAARSAAVSDYGTTTSCTVVAESSAPVIPDSTKRLLCRAKERIGLAESSVRVSITLPSTYVVGSTILMCAQAPFGNRTKVLTSAISSFILKNKLSMRAESVDSTLTSFAEVPLPGSSWSWCV